MQMKQKLNQERLSALLDNELTEFELRQVLRDSSDDELQVLSRWQLAQDALASKPAAIAPEGFAVQVQAAIGQIPQRGKPQWWSGIAKTMVAASVAAATVTVGWQFWQVEEASVAPATMASSSGQSYLDQGDRKSTRLNSSHVSISYAVFCLKKKKHTSTYCTLYYNGRCSEARRMKIRCD